MPANLINGYIWLQIRFLKYILPRSKNEQPGLLTAFISVQNFCFGVTWQGTCYSLWSCEFSSVSRCYHVFLQFTSDGNYITTPVAQLNPWSNGQISRAISPPQHRNNTIVNIDKKVNFSLQ